MHNNINDLKSLEKILNSKLIVSISIILLLVQLIYVTVGSTIDTRHFYNIDIMSIIIIAFIILLILFILILIESLKCKRYSKQRLNSGYKKMLGLIFIRTLVTYCIAFAYLMIPIILNDSLFNRAFIKSFISILAVILLVFNMNIDLISFIYGINQEYESIEQNNLSINSYIYNSKDYLWKSLVFILTIVFLGYSGFLMYERGYKGQVAFFSDFLSIIATVFVTNYFTDKKLIAGRINDFRNSLYLEDYKTIHNAINMSLRLENMANNINFRISIIKHNKGSYKDYVESFNNNLKDKIRKLDCVTQSFGIKYVYLLKRNHSNLENGYKLLKKTFNNMIKFYNHHILIFRSNYSNYSNIMKLYPKIKEVQESFHAFTNKLYNINNEYKEKVK